MCHLTPNSSEKTGFVSSKPSDTAPNTDAVRDEVDKLLCPDCKIFYDGYNCSKCGFLNEESDEGGKLNTFRETLKESVIKAMKTEKPIKLYGTIAGQEVSGIIGKDGKISYISYKRQDGVQITIEIPSYGFSIADVAYGSVSCSLDRFELIDDSQKTEVERVIKNYHIYKYEEDKNK